MKCKIYIILFILCSHYSIAHEGMWLPLLQEQNIFPIMQQAGCKLSENDIYDVNNASLKDAIVQVGSDCSGGIISNNGLVITNHHCVESFIHKQSSVAQNYLHEGFWAKNHTQEIPAHGLYVSVLHQIIDVSKDVLSDISDTLSAQDFYMCTQAKIDSIIAVYTLHDSTLHYSIEPLYGGNQYLLFSSRRFSDVRLVGFMPANIASFGADLDNWMWPRHAADFALLRIYVDTLQNAADFSEHNVPYIPRTCLSIDTSGIKEGDFTMLMGYPAQTNNYATSYETSRVFFDLNPLQIELRKRKLAAIHEYIQLGGSQSLQYHATYYSLLNYYVKWQAEQEGVQRYKIIERKQTFENDMQEWIKTQQDISENYSNILALYDSAYAQYFTSYIALVTYAESVWKMDFFMFAEKVLPLYYAALKNTVDTHRVERIRKVAADYYVNIAPHIEQKLLPDIMSYLDSNLNVAYMPEIYRDFSISERNDYIQSMIHESILFQKDAMDIFLKKIHKKRYQSRPQNIVKMMEQDKGIQFVIQTRAVLSEILFPQYYNALLELEYCTKKYMSVMRTCTNQTPMSPDANGTLRVSFGNILGYSNADAIYYAPQTTSYGLQQKWNLQHIAYPKDEILDSLCNQHNKGSFFSDTVYVNFIGTNHTTGGSSGSPVLNAYGSMIGLNFDRSSESAMSDLYYDAAICRNIMVDIRYVLFCIQMYGKSPHLIQEMSFFTK